MRLGEDDRGESRRLQPLSLQVTEHPPDWGTLGDPAETTLERCRQLGNRLLTGAWFLDPVTTIHSPTDSPEFQQAAAQAQTRWRRTLTNNLNGGNKGFRRAVQKVVREAMDTSPGRLAQAFPETVPSSSSKDLTPAPLSHGPSPDRHRIRAFVRLRKQLAVTGITIIDGRLLDPRDRRSTGGKPPEIQEHRRRCDFSPLITGTDLTPFLETSRGELRLHLAANPNAPLYVTPGITVVGQVFNSAFLKKARKAESWWHDLTYTEIGRPRLKVLSRAAEEAAGMLFFHGTLVANGLFYRPGRWPSEDHNAAQSHLDGSTVPAEVLGLS